VLETESQHKYLVCLVLQQTYYKDDQTNLANLLYPLASNNPAQLLEKVLYENLEHCLATITSEDEELVLENLKNENELVTLYEKYVLPQEALSKKLGSLQLSVFQNKVKTALQKDFAEELKLIKSGLELVKKKLDSLTGGQQKAEQAEKRSKYSNDRGSKIYKAVTWAAVVIALTIVGSILKNTYDKNSGKLTAEEEADRKKKKLEYAQKKKEEKALQIQQAKQKKEDEKRKQKTGFQKNVKVKDNDKAADDESDDDNIGLKQVYEALKKKKEQNKIIPVGGNSKPSKSKEPKEQPQQVATKATKKDDNKQQPAKNQQQPAKNQQQPAKNDKSQQQPAKGQAQPQQEQQPAKGKKGAKQAEPEVKKEEVVIQTPAPKEPENWTVIAGATKKKGKKNEGGKKKKGGDD